MNFDVTSSSGQKLWEKAKRLIPGGNMLLSKRAEMFLPSGWPAYYSKAKGCYTWDLDGNQYVDMSIMGVGTNILGYSDPDVDEAVKQAISSSNMSSLNCPEEVWLAESLIEIHPWADMVRLARTGGEANAIAVRIARAATGRDAIAICGYHGWHDWYLATNLQDENSLEEHLLPGLQPNGVPAGLKGTTLPFSYNRLDQLEKLIAENSIAAVKMEVKRNDDPCDGFLEGVRSLCSRNGIVLIFDECTSGFRETVGGLHLKYGIEPDMAIFGKALGNGYAITSIIGRRSVMESTQSTFISSTFWTERIGPSAALKTLEKMDKVESWKAITHTGHNVKRLWQELSDKYGLKICISGLDSLASFSFVVPEANKYKTLLTQEMLKRGYLASTSFYASTAHTVDIIERYSEDLREVFQLIAECMEEGSIDSLLDGPVCQSGFKRLN